MTARRTLDKTDIAILAALYKDARLNNKDIAGLVGLAPSSSLERIRKMQADGVIGGSLLKVDLVALGGNIQAMVSVRLSNHNRETIDNFQNQLSSLAEVISIYHMGGDIDFLLHVSVSDAIHLRDFVFESITDKSEVSSVETALVYEHIFSDELPKV